MSPSLELPAAPPSAEGVTAFLLVLQIPYSSASPGNYVVSTCVCVCVCVDITSHSGRGAAAAQMWRGAPVCRLGAEHLACPEGFQLPLVQLWLFLARIVISLLLTDCPWCCRKHSYT